MLLYHENSRHANDVKKDKFINQKVQLDTPELTPVNSKKECFGNQFMNYSFIKANEFKNYLKDSFNYENNYNQYPVPSYGGSSLPSLDYYSHRDNGLMHESFGNEYLHDFPIKGEPEFFTPAFDLENLGATEESIKAKVHPLTFEKCKIKKEESKKTGLKINTSHQERNNYVYSPLISPMSHLAMDFSKIANLN